MYKYVKVNENDFVEMLEAFEFNDKKKYKVRFSKDAKSIIYYYIQTLQNAYKMCFTESVIEEIYSMFTEYKDINEYNKNLKETSGEEFIVKEIKEIKEDYDLIEIPNSNSFIVVYEQLDFNYVEK